MKTLILGLTISILFSSIPAKIWACGFHLCPVVSYQSGNIIENQSMPCHEQANERPTNKSNPASKLKFTEVVAEKVCSCSDDCLSSNFVTNPRSNFDTSKTKLVQVVNYKLLDPNCNTDLTSHNRNLLIISPIRLHVIHQVFII